MLFDAAPCTKQVTSKVTVFLGQYFIIAQLSIVVVDK